MSGAHQYPIASISDLASATRAFGRLPPWLAQDPAVGAAHSPVAAKSASAKTVSAKIVWAGAAVPTGAAAAQRSGGATVAAGGQNLHLCRTRWCLTRWCRTRWNLDGWLTGRIPSLAPDAADAIPAGATAALDDSRQGPAMGQTLHAGTIWEIGLSDHPDSASSRHPRPVHSYHRRDRPYGNPAPFCSTLEHHAFA